MEDDVTVGVQLLLEDGVSDALIAMMKQLDAADRAIAATSANWRGLPVEDGAPLSPPQQSRELPTGTSMPIAVPEADNLGPQKQSGDGPGSNIIAAATAAAPFQLAPLDVPSLRLDLAPVHFAPAQPGGDTTGDRWPDIANAPGAAEYDATPPIAAIPAAPIGVELAPPTSPLSMPSGFAPSLETAAVAPIPPGVSIAVLPEARRSDDKGWDAEPPMPSTPSFSPPLASVAPREPDIAPPVLPGTDVTPSGGTALDIMATAPGDEVGGGEGQLLLDGSLLGRWIVDHLAREADRPPAGVTAFDPRQGRSWPGVGYGG